MERLYGVCHCANRLSVIFIDNNIIRLVRIFAPYGVSIFLITTGSSIQAMTLTVPPHSGHVPRSDLILSQFLEVCHVSLRSDWCSNEKTVLSGSHECPCSAAKGRHRKPRQEGRGCLISAMAILTQSSSSSPSGKFSSYSTLPGTNFCVDAALCFTSLLR
jgi:hypothetical protein